MKTLTERLGHSPNTQELVDDVHERIDDLEKRVAALEALADEKEGRPSESGHAKGARKAG